MEELYEKVCGVINRHIRVSAERIIPKARLYADLRLDALDLYAVMIDIETTFGLVFSNTRWGKLRTVADIVEYIRLETTELAA